MTRRHAQRIRGFVPSLTGRYAIPLPGKTLRGLRAYQRAEEVAYRIVGGKRRVMEPLKYRLGNPGTGTEQLASSVGYVVPDAYS